MNKLEFKHLALNTLRGLVMGGTILAFATSAYAKNQEQSQENENTSNEDKESSDENETAEAEEKVEKVDMLVPKALRKSGLTVRIDSKDYSLNSRRIKVPQTEDLETIEIRDSGGRIVSNTKLFIGKHILREQRPRPHSLSLKIGESYSPASHWKKILFDQTRLQSSLDYEYQPGLIGILLSLVNQSNDSSFKNGIKSKYAASQLRLAVRALFAPFSEGNSILRRIHLGIYVGGLSTTHWLKYSDLRDSITYKSTNNGLVTGYDFSHIITKNFWVQVRADMTWQMIQFKELNFKQLEAQQGYGLGVKYAF